MEFAPELQDLTRLDRFQNMHSRLRDFNTIFHKETVTTKTPPVFPGASEEINEDDGARTRNLRRDRPVL